MKYNYKDKIATTIRIDITTWEKFKIIAQNNMRSTNSELEFLIHSIVKNYENEKGIISIPSDDVDSKDK